VTILILTEEGDVHADYVIKSIQHLGGECIRFHTDTLIGNTRYSYSFSRSGLYDRMTIIDSDRSFSWNEIKAVYYRRPRKPLAPSIIKDDGTRDYVQTEADSLLQGIYQNMLKGKLWINDPTSNRTAGNKLGQLRTAFYIGLQIPDTIVTNQPEAAYQFFLECDKGLICKSMKQELAISNDRSVFIFTHAIPRTATLDTFEEVRFGSSILQRRVRKVSDLRVTLVGQQCFAVEVENDMVDWRSADPYSLHHKIIDLPSALERKLFELQNSYGLVSSQIDLLRTPNDEYVFLEINPNGQWLWIQLLTGMPIAEAIANILMGNCKDMDKNDA